MNELMTPRLRQFKFEFGGYKNLSAADWTDTILPAIRKRSRDGSESDVYFRGELLCPKRVRREQVRYLSSLPNDMSVVGTPQGVCDTTIAFYEQITAAYLVFRVWNQPGRQNMHPHTVNKYSFDV